MKRSTAPGGAAARNSTLRRTSRSRPTGAALRIVGVPVGARNAAGRSGARPAHYLSAHAERDVPEQAARPAAKVEEAVERLTELPRAPTRGTLPSPLAGARPS